MVDHGRLPDALHEHLCAAVSEVFWSALRGLPGQASLSAAPNISHTIQSSLRIAIANDLRLCNARFSPQERLPNEVWCTIWNCLSFPDLVAVSHVCNHWRAVSRGCRTLWANPTLYTARSKHYDGYSCDMCETQYDDAPGYCDNNPYHAGSCNMPFIDQIFALSGDLPLHIRIDVVPYCPDEKILVRLASALVSHAHRISGLILFAEHSPALPIIMADLDELPILASFSANAYDPHVADWTVKLFKSPMQLPLLERIVLGNDYEWPPFPAPYLRNVRTLAFAPRDPETLLATLRACTRLEELSLGFLRLSFSGSSVLLCGQIRNLLATVKRINLRFVSSWSEQWIIAAFSRPETRHFSVRLQYSPEDAFPLSHTIFKDLHDAVRLTIAAKDGWGFRSLEITDGHGRTRALLSCDKHLARTLARVLDRSCVRTDTLLHITVDLTCWDDFASACPPLLAATSLELTIHEMSDPRGVIERAVTSSHSSPLPELKDLQIIYTGGSTLAVRLSDIESLARRVASRLPLHTLKLRGLFHIHEEPVPHGLAQDFHVVNIVAYEKQLFNPFY